METIKGDNCSEEDNERWCAYCIRDRTRPEYTEEEMVSTMDNYLTYGMYDLYCDEEYLTSTEEVDEQEFLPPWGSESLPTEKVS